MLSCVPVLLSRDELSNGERRGSRPSVGQQAARRRVEEQRRWRIRVFVGGAVSRPVSYAASTGNAGGGWWLAVCLRGVCVCVVRVKVELEVVEDGWIFAAT